jgi:hypothetical protein
MATHRYVTRNSRVFLVRLNLIRKRYCTGSWAQVIDGVPRERVQCPVCDRLCAVSSKGRIWSHYTPTQLEENMLKIAVRSKVS